MFASALPQPNDGKVAVERAKVDGMIIVATDLSFHSQNIGQGATFAYTFDKPGDFTYVCGIHPQMTGTITVTG